MLTQSPPQSSPVNFIVYGIAGALLITSAIAGYNAGMFAFTAETVFYVSGLAGLLLFLVMSAGRGGKPSGSFIFTRILLGILAMGVSLYYSWQFISAGASGIVLAVAAVFVLVTEGAKILYTSDVAFYAATGQGEKAAYTGIMVLVLFGLSIAATVYNLTSSSSVEREKQLQKEQGYQRLVANSDSLAAALATHKQALADCPHDYYTNCKKPALKRIAATQAKLDIANDKLAAYKPSTGGAAFWSNISEFTNSTPANTELMFHFMRGSLLELLGLLLIAQATAASRIQKLSNSYHEQNITPPKQQLSNGLAAANTAAAIPVPTAVPTATDTAADRLGLERVAPELSGKGGKGRVGKLDSCIDCGQDFIVKIHHAKRCPICAEKAQDSYRLSQAKVA